MNNEERCSTGPRRMPKDPINVKEPQVKDIANFCGFTGSIGIPKKNARAKKSTDRNSKPQNTCYAQF